MNVHLNKSDLLLVIEDTIYQYQKKAVGNDFEAILTYGEGALRSLPARDKEHVQFLQMFRDALKGV